MILYCVWFDNFFQELFAIEKADFDKYEKLQKCLQEEKNTVYYVVAESMKDAFDNYRELQLKASAIVSSGALH